MDWQERAIRIMEDDRRRFVRDLQDGLLQILSNTSMRLDFLMRSMDVETAQAHEEILRVYRRLDQAIVDVRHLIDDLQPVPVAEVGLGTALVELAHRLEQEWGVPITVVDDSAGASMSRVTADLMLYRAVQEAVTNAVKHAQTERIIVRLYRKGPHLRIDVVDDGRGFDPQYPHPGQYGLGIMSDRIAAVGGGCLIESELGRGTQVHFSVPMPARSHAQ
ncbi:sensor histidine kinase [Sulfobacillus harzensis]|uniref:histidine kinase n=1 Tax=Sulfobacillus harzensis TaxID=2729629 RepID=A0A7Y0L801_9FIRM|nr:sensor histidine kinase [Sulfobacillus harzensis]NMP24987.1 sensor histidine kinase [Sulfobacillus harzensis]